MKRLRLLPARDRAILDVIRSLGGSNVTFAKIREHSGYPAGQVQSSLDRLISYRRVFFRLSADRIETHWTLSSSSDAPQLAGEQVSQ